MLLSGVAESSAQNRTAAVDLPHDSTLLSTVLGVIRNEEGRAIRVDPRPLRADPRISYFVHAQDFEERDATVVEARTAVLSHHGTERFTFGNNDHCEVGRGGLAPPVDPDDTAAVARARAWRDVRPVCVLVGLPRPGGAYYPYSGTFHRSGIDERARGIKRKWVSTRVITIRPGQTTVYDVVSARRGGRWRVLKVVKLDQTWS